MRKSLYTIFSLVIFLVLISGCASQRSWVYRPNIYCQGPTICSKTAVVLPFIDERKNINKNRIALNLIPLMPFGWADYNIPEGQQMHLCSGIWMNYKPTEDFAKALAQELENAHVFSDTYFDFRKRDSDIVIKGEILSTKYKEKMITYGLSVYGPLLWLIGLPSGTASNELSLRLTCLDENSNRILFSREYSAPRYSKVSWIYAVKNDFNYPTMLKDIYAHFVLDLMRSNLRTVN